MDKKIVGRHYYSSTICSLESDDYWKAVNEIHDRVLYEGETEWVEEKLEAMSIDKDIQTAIQTAMGSTLNFLVQTVYASGFNGLVEYRQFERGLEDARQPQHLDA